MSKPDEKYKEGDQKDKEDINKSKQFDFTGLENGPCEDRSCTDYICCVLFLVSTGAMIYIAYLGLTHGQPSKLMVAYDADGNACGVDDKVKDYPLIYLALPWKGYLNHTTCVKKCPNWELDTPAPTTFDCVPNKIITDCKVKYPGNLDYESFKPSAALTITDLGTAQIIYNSTGYWNRICLPSDMNFVKNTNLSKIFNTSELEKYFTDVKNSWQIILASALFALVISFIFMFIMRYFAGLMVWTAIILYFLGLTTLVIYFMNTSEAKMMLSVAANDQQVKDQLTGDAKNLKYVAYAMATVLLVSFIGVFCIWNSINLAIAVIKSAAVFIGDTPMILLLPPTITIITLAYWALWMVVFVFLMASGEIKSRTDSPMATVVYNEEEKKAMWYWLFGGLWINAFILALNQFILASSVGIWYFSDKEIGAKLPISTSLYRAYRYHLGSLAFGSLLLAIVQFIRIVLAYITYQVKNAGGDQNKYVMYILTCLQCFVACFERFIEFLNRNAYIQIALKGTNFCTSAKNAFVLILNNAGRFAIVLGIGEVFVFMGKLFVGLATGYVCYTILTTQEPWMSVLFSPLLPTFFCMMIGYIVGNMFMSVYGMGIDTILQCAIIDEQIQGKNGKPALYQPQPLKDYFGTSEPEKKTDKKEIEMAKK